ncbi:hypothetical protein DE146DRAFT_243483 [Phaeosphaeria sp. MPI-PUGE-AT-0046c]|nr:hypothetical protein DE146DRAFT_243483 [Phaeosphaeria sp. MPI-PUGE-AT-0046c]
MPPEALPPELWHLIIATFNDDCFVWCVLRHVSSYLRQVTEDVFARHVLRSCSVRFAGESAKKLLPSDLQEPVATFHNAQTRTSYAMAHYSTHLPLYRPPTFCFQPCVFMPEDSKTKLVLTLCDPASDPSLAMADPKPTTVPFDRLTDIFFDPGPAANSNRLRLINDAHFVRYNNQLKSMRLPSLVIDTNARNITLDWRLLYQKLLYDEWKCRVNSGVLGAPWFLKLTPE